MSGFLEGESGGGGGGPPTGAAGGNLGGTYPNPTVVAINNVTVTGTPSAGQVIEATSSTAASWQTPATPFTLLYSNFFALMPGDNGATIAQNAPVLFPQNGPTNGAATSLGAGLFNLPTIGTYEIAWQVSISEAGQLQLAIGGVGLPDTVVGRATPTSQIVGNTLITTVATNSHLSVINPSGNPTALTVTPLAGGSTAVSATLTIKYLG